MDTLQKTIDEAWEARGDLSPARGSASVRDGVAHVIDALDRGELRVAEKIHGVWTTHQWIKKAVLLSFRLADNAAIGIAGPQAPFRFYDKVRTKFAAFDDAAFAAAGVRVVPPAVARRGAYVAPDVVLMPSYVNIGAYVGEGTMVDTWATVGSCAQIGRNVHLSGGVGIGGVLEPLQANPTIIEDNCDIGATIQKHAEGHGFSVVREFCGHGIGRQFHEEPQVLHYGRAGTGVELRPGMTFTIEPMINAGRAGIRCLADGWTIVTADHSLSAQWEHTVLVTDDGYEILTQSAGTPVPPPAEGAAA